jgi:hypothetical protein
MRKQYKTKNIIDLRNTIINNKLKSVDTSLFREKLVRTNSYGSKFCDTIEECLIYLNENKLKYVDILLLSGYQGDPNNPFRYCLIFERLGNE